MANIGFISLGCAKNQVDCERMMYRVQEAGHTVKSDVVGSDVVVINTCGFIDSAKSEAIDYILQTAALKAEGLVGKILVTGCLSQRYQGDILKEMPEVDGILGTGSYTEIVPAIEKLLNGEQVVDFGSIDAPEVETGRIMTTAGHYAFIKIAEGCDNHCSYCVIPSLRGKYRSRQMDDVLYEARMLADSGVKELIVVAQDPAVTAQPCLGTSGSCRSFCGSSARSTDCTGFASTTSILTKSTTNSFRSWPLSRRSSNIWTSPSSTATAKS